MRRNVLVLMSVYNGEFYLQEQIDSVLEQKDIDVHLLIRDDGSSDNSVNIIKMNAYKDSRVRLIEGENIGCTKSFMALCKEALSCAVKYDFYSFCDQDDIWFENKLVKSVSVLSSFDSHAPCLYMATSIATDEKLNDLHIKTL